MLDPRLVTLALLSINSLAMAETRFGRPVVKLAFPKLFESIQLEENRFSSLQRNSIEVACIAYREGQRYYVEVAVTNHSAGPIVLDKDFVQFKTNENIPALDTLAIAAEVQKSATSSAPAPGLSTSRGSTINPGSSISPNAEHKGGSQMLVEAMAQNSQVQANQLAARLTTYAHEKQTLTIDPKGTRFYVFVFEQTEKKRTPFDLTVSAASENWVFAYKE
jgi:hypothetical protein